MKEKLSRFLYVEVVSWTSYFLLISKDKRKKKLPLACCSTNVRYLSTLMIGHKKYKKQNPRIKFVDKNL